jgi:hypothetical protein
MISGFENMSPFSGDIKYNPRFKYVFTYSPGRCGTLLLKKALSGIPEILCVHETKIKWLDLYTRTQLDPEDSKIFWARKLRRINIMLGAKRACTFIKTGHQFKYVYPFYPGGGLSKEDFPKIGLIKLERNYREVASSLYELDNIPGRTVTGIRSCYHPLNINNIIDISNFWGELSPYQLCYWYCLETEERYNKYIADTKLGGERTYTLTLKDLIQGDITDLYAFLGIENAVKCFNTERWAAMTKQPCNAKSGRKKNARVRLHVLPLSERDKHIQEEILFNKLKNHGRGLW